jgi:hypothetical protein
LFFSNTGSTTPASLAERPWDGNMVTLVVRLVMVAAF